MLTEKQQKASVAIYLICCALAISCVWLVTAVMLGASSAYAFTACGIEIITILTLWIVYFKPFKK